MKIKLLCTALLAMSFATTNAQTGKASWGRTNYEDAPWVKNVSRPNEITDGLQNRHLSVWSSHGRYYDAKKVDGDGKGLSCLVLPRIFTHKR